MVADELLEVLFFKNFKGLRDNIICLRNLYYPNEPEKYINLLNLYIYNSIKSKENFLCIIDDYNRNGLPIWQTQEAQNCDNIDINNLMSILMHGTFENGERIYHLYKLMKEEWAYHLDDYAELVNHKDNINILELATGAGLGTCAVMESLQPNSRIISIDIDFGAAKNADGLAKYLNIENRACALNANFWKLPFENDLFDIICTHYGLDESAELPTTLSQISKTLKPSGEFIGVCRKYPFDRHKRLFEMFDINVVECNVLLNRARLYGGFENLEILAKNCGLRLINYKEYDQQTSHKRILFQFIKG